MLGSKHYLINMLDPSVKHMLCVILDTDKGPKTWEVIANGKFFIINSQHSIVANKDMQTLVLPENIVKHFRQWKCFIVWSKDKSRFRQILGYYNQCNLFSIFKPTSGINVLGARFIWIELGHPTPSKSTTELGQSARMIKNFKNGKKYKIGSYPNVNFKYVS
jgi:hypothetical protein